LFLFLSYLFNIVFVSSSFIVVNFVFAFLCVTIAKINKECKISGKDASSFRINKKRIQARIKELSQFGADPNGGVGVQLQAVVTTFGIASC